MAPVHIIIKRTRQLASDFKLEFLIKKIITKLTSRSACHLMCDILCYFLFSSFNFRYLRQVLDENLRCSFVAAWAAKIHEADLTLGGYIIPKNVNNFYLN